MSSDHPQGERIRVRGLVQGVGFRPTVWRLARDGGLDGDVRNDGGGVLIRIWGSAEARERFRARLCEECPPLARIDELRSEPLAGPPPERGFRIVASAHGEVHTGVVPDAATCVACQREIGDPCDRRFRYPFTNCTHCGPRLSIVRAIPYDRAHTSMSVFPMCAACRAEYEDPADRRFHAQPNACPACGPRVWLEDAAGHRLDPPPLGARDAVEAASRLLDAGRILAVKGIGGFHLACDAGNREAVAELRRRKRRRHKPFALMARDLAAIERYCHVNAAEAALLTSSAAPVLLLDVHGRKQVASAVAPGQRTLGFMLPYSPLHQLLLEAWERPLVMTSGNLSEEPQCAGNPEARGRLSSLADLFLVHDRDIANRVDDSVIRFMDQAPRLIRRARGYAPSPLPLPAEFAAAPPLVALGGELKNSICLLKDGQAMPSQHLGDLENVRTAEVFEQTIDLYLKLFGLVPERLAVDRHPDYRSTRFGEAWAARAGLPLERVQHHHAHIAAVLADSGWPVAGGPVLGIALDGLGYGDDGTLWGGEFLLVDYSTCRRLGRLRPAPMPGGGKAVQEPWRNAYAHLATHMGWDTYLSRYADLELTEFLQTRPLDLLTTMLERGLNSPQSSSCGRLFDAVAAALGICRETVSYEGQAAVELEALASGGSRSYPFRIDRGPTLWELDPAPMWRALLDDRRQKLPIAEAAGAFHRGLAQAVVEMGIGLARREAVASVALSGGVFQNRTLFEAVAGALKAAGLQVLTHRRVPMNDAGLSLGQAVVAAARRLS